jgi:hypothetical protein
MSPDVRNGTRALAIWIALGALVAIAAAQTPSKVDYAPAIPPVTWPVFVDVAAAKSAPGTVLADAGSGRGSCWVDIVGRDPANPGDPALVGGPDGLLDLVITNSNTPALPLGSSGANQITPPIGDEHFPSEVFRAESDGTYSAVAQAMVAPGSVGWDLRYPGGSPWGVTAGDYDADGDSDLYYACGGFHCSSPNALLRNEGNGSFTNTTVSAGTVHVQDSFAAGWLDYDLDGDLDLYVANSWAILPAFYEGSFTALDNRLYRNNGNATFTDVGAAAGVNLKSNSFALSFGDLDQSGTTDIVVSCYDQYNKVFFNEGDGTFGFMAPKGNGVVDLTLAVLEPDAAYPSSEDFPFVAPGMDALVPLLPVRGMGIDIQDFNGDGWLDLIGAAWSYQLDDADDTSAAGAIFSPAEPAALYLNRGDQDGDGKGDGFFRECAAEVGADHVGGTMGVVFGDFNSDGAMDLYMGGGGPYVDYQFEEDYLYVANGAAWPVDFQRDPDQPLTKVYWEIGALAGAYVNTWMCHGTIAAPVGGRLDLMVANGGPATFNAGQPDRYFQNTGNADGVARRLMEVSLAPVQSNPGAEGARMRVVRDGFHGSSQTVVAERHSSGNFSSHNAGPLVAGLGTDGVLFADVRWPSGVRQGRLLWPDATALTGLAFAETTTSLSVDVSYPAGGGALVSLAGLETGAAPTGGALVFGSLHPQAAGPALLGGAFVIAPAAILAPGVPLSISAPTTGLPRGLYVALLLDLTTGATLAAAADWHEPALELPFALAGAAPAAGGEPAASGRLRWDAAARASAASPSAPRPLLRVRERLLIEAAGIELAPAAAPLRPAHVDLSGQGTLALRGATLSWNAGRAWVEIDASRAATLDFGPSGAALITGLAIACCDRIGDGQGSWIALPADARLEVDGVEYSVRGERLE